MSEPDPRELEDTHRAFMSAFNSGDLDRAFSFLTDDFVAMVEEQPSMGKAAYRSFVEPFSAAHSTDFSFELDDTITAGEWAFERIRYTGTITERATGDTQPVSWRAVALWRRLPGGWKVARYIRTPDPPAPV